LSCLLESRCHFLPNASRFVLILLNDWSNLFLKYGYAIYVDEYFGFLENSKIHYAVKLIEIGSNTEYTTIIHNSTDINNFKYNFLRTGRGLVVGGFDFLDKQSKHTEEMLPNYLREKQKNRG